MARVSLLVTVSFFLTIAHLYLFLVVVLDAWARSGDRAAPHRAEQILDHMDDLYRAGNRGVKPDTYTYNTLVSPTDIFLSDGNAFVILTRLACLLAYLSSKD